MIQLKYPPPPEFLKAETRDGYRVSEKMKEVWAIELDLAQELLRVCEKHNLKIFAICGTLLGSIRHKGFVPWDDDVDFAMFRDDYRRLCQIAAEEFRDPYFWQESESGEELVYGCAKLRNSKTTAIEGKRNLPYNQGVFIDIFPIDNLSDGKIQRFFQKRKGNLYRTLTWGAAFFSTRFYKSGNAYIDIVKTGIHVLFGRLLLKLQPVFFKKMITVSKQYNKNATNLCKIFVISSMRQDFYKESFAKSEQVPFEFIKIPVMSGYDDVLKALFGDNWRTPIQAPNGHGPIFFDTDKSYLCYQNHSLNE